MLYAAADYRRAEIVMNQYFDKVPVMSEICQITLFFMQQVQTDTTAA